MRSLYHSTRKLHATDRQACQAGLIGTIDPVTGWCNRDMVQSMSSILLESMTVESAAAGFSALGDPIRLRILGELAQGKRCVCELLEQIDVAANLLSYHLRVLRDAGLVDASRRGRWIDYRLVPDELDALREAMPVEPIPTETNG